MAALFISYRRADSAGWAGRLKDHLEARYGSELVWQDVDDIGPGEQWLAKILEALRSADAVLVIIGPRWLELGASRLGDPSDVLRQEIEAALASSSIVVPVLVGGAAIPRESDLPTSLRALAGRQAIGLLDGDWHRSVQLLTDGLRTQLDRLRDSLPLPALQEDVFDREGRFFAVLDRDPRQALQLARETLAVLERQLPHHPQDVFLLQMRGYFHKNQALALAALGEADASEQALGKAERAFRVMRDELEAYLAGAYNGIGSVEAMRGRLSDSLHWIDRALALQPDDPAARHDRELVAKALRARAGSRKPGRPGRRTRR